MVEGMSRRCWHISVSRIHYLLKEPKEHPLRRLSKRLLCNLSSLHQVALPTFREELQRNKNGWQVDGLNENSFKFMKIQGIYHETCEIKSFIMPYLQAATLWPSAAVTWMDNWLPGAYKWLDSLFPGGGIHTYQSNTCQTKKISYKKSSLILIC